MLLSKGEKIFVVLRRLFETEVRRSFVGEVMEASDVAIKAQGYEFIYDEANNNFVRSELERSRIFSLIDAGTVLRVLPNDINYEKIHYGWKGNQRVLTDEESFVFHINVFGVLR
jgi:hypothetical protein